MATFPSSLYGNGEAGSTGVVQLETTGLRRNLVTVFCCQKEGQEAREPGPPQGHKAALPEPCLGLSHGTREEVSPRGQAGADRGATAQDCTGWC